MMIRIYPYNDLGGFNTSIRVRKVKANLCTWYYVDRKRFCGNYCSRRRPHGSEFNRRCWRHKRVGDYSASLPPMVLLMIASSERIYNRDLWIKFLIQCQKKCVPIELVIYHEDMLNNTVRESHNLLSRLRPFPDKFIGKILPLRNAHGSINFAQILLRMLDYGSKIPHTSRCIVITERTIPIRSPEVMYRRALYSKCHIDISYNVGNVKLPDSLLPRGRRNKEFPTVNNIAQGLYTKSFLDAALPTVPQNCAYFGISINTDGVYTVSDRDLYEHWQALTSANADEFWLLNSFVLSLHNKNENRPLRILKEYMEDYNLRDRYTVAEIPVWRGGVKRTFIFKNFNKRERIQRYDLNVKKYYDELDLEVNGVTLDEVIKFVCAKKWHALFFRQVETPEGGVYD